jgi:hypothetical protein
VGFLLGWGSRETTIAASGAPPFAWALPHHAMEDAVRTGLVGEARLDCDLGERQRRRQHQMLRSFCRRSIAQSMKALQFSSAPYER